MTQNLPSRALTKAASSLGDHRRFMKERGGDLEGYQKYYGPRYVAGQKLLPADIDKMYAHDLETLKSLEIIYATLQAERSGGASGK